MSTDPHDEAPPGAAALAAVRLWVADGGSVAARLTTVDDLAAPVEHVYVTNDLHELSRRLEVWLAATAGRLTN